MGHGPVVVWLERVEAKQGGAYLMPQLPQVVTRAGTWMAKRQRFMSAVARADVDMLSC